MSALLERALADSDAPSAREARRGGLRAALRAIADGPLARLADDIDRRGVYPREILEQVGAAGGLGAHLALGGTQEPDLGAGIEAIAEISRVCGSTGFLMWCQAVCGLYMEQSGNPAQGGAALAAIASGSALGGTGMSNPMKTFAGIETMLLRAKPDPSGDGFLVDGALPWVSNLGPDHRFGAVARVVGAEGEPEREIMFIARGDGPGVELRGCPTFSAMEGTNTFAVRFTRARIGRDDLVADPVRPFVGRIRAAFVLLQCGFGLGVAQGAIDSMRTVERALGHVNVFLDERPDDLQPELDLLRARTLRLADDPFAQDAGAVADVLDARAEASEIALRAAQSALLHAGARGYVMTSPVQRRVRESHFVAIVTPALKHLRKEIARLRAGS